MQASESVENKSAQIFLGAWSRELWNWTVANPGLILRPSDRRFRRGSRRDKNHFSLARVVQLFASFLLNRTWIGLEPLDTLGELRILFLQAIDFAFQRLHLRPLLPVNDNPIRSQHRV